MRHFRFLQGSLSALFFTACVAVAGEVRLEVTANRDRVYLGESFILSVRISGERSPPEPDLSGIERFKIRSLGSQSQDQVSITFINGRMTRTGFFGRLFSYELTPERTGELRAGPVRLQVGNRILTAPGPWIKVLGFEEQEWVKLLVTASRDTALVDDEFELTLSILLKRLPGTFADADPLDPRDPPHLQVPFLEESSIEGLEGPNVRELLEKYLVTRPDQPGLAINNYTVRSDPFHNLFDFESIFERKPARFRFSRQAVEWNGKPYFQYTIKLTYRTRDEGTYTFGPVIFRGSVLTAVDHGLRVGKESVLAVGSACTVRVVPPPEEGRPLCFIGAIGTNLTAEAMLDTQTCKVGDPLCLTVSVSGPANLRNVRPPPLGAQKDLIKLFRVYEDTVRMVRQDGTVEFIWTLRPTVVGTLELPPIGVAYYDPVERAYRVAYTQPLPVRVRPAVQVKTGDLVNLATNDMTFTLTLRTGLPVPAPITVVATGAVSEPILPSRASLLAAGLGPVVFGLVLSGRAVRRGLARRRLRSRRLRAASRARQTLQAARCLAGSQRMQASRQIIHALRRYVADRLGMPEGGMTPADGAACLIRHGVSAERVKAFHTIFQNHFDAYYQAETSLPLDPRADATAAIAIVEEIDAELVQREKSTVSSKTS